MFTYLRSIIVTARQNIDMQSYTPDILGSETTLAGVINYVSVGFVYILGSFAVLSMLYGAYLYVIAGGNEELMTRAKTFMRYPILGLVIGAMAYLIIKLIGSIILGNV